MVNKLTIKEEVANAFQGILKGIPYIGTTLDQWIFGRISEIRSKRILDLLEEIGEKLKEKKSIEKEEWFALLEDAMPQIARSTSEERLRAFKNILINASRLNSGDSEWDNSRLACDLISEIDAPGLAILAGLAKCRKSQTLLVFQPNPRIVDGGVDEKGIELNDSVLPFYEVNFDPVVVEEWARRLQSKRLISTRSHIGDRGWGGVALTQLGKFLVHWAEKDRDIL